MLYVLYAWVETACLSSRHPSGVLLSPVGTLDDKQAVERSGTPAKKSGGRAQKARLRHNHNILLGYAPARNRTRVSSLGQGEHCTLRSVNSQRNHSICGLPKRNRTSTLTADRPSRANLTNTNPSRQYPRVLPYASQQLVERDYCRYQR